MQGKVLGSNEAILCDISRLFVRVVPICEGIAKQIESDRTGTGIHQDEKCNMLGKAGSHASNGKLQTRIPFTLCDIYLLLR